MINNQTQGTETRRGFIKKLVGGAAALLLAGTFVAAGLPTNVGAAESNFKSTAPLNLRSQANTSSAVILVIPQGGQVTQVGPDLNGFKNVSYSGKSGYAHANYLVPSNGGGGSEIPATIGVWVTTANVNMREGAGTNFKVLKTLPAGTHVEVYDMFKNGYWLVSHQGQFGYAHGLYLSSEGGPQETMMTTTANLNMRTEPSTIGQIVKVVPAGAQVIAGPASANGYRAVTYGQFSGWVLAAYIK